MTTKISTRKTTVKRPAAKVKAMPAAARKLDAMPAEKPAAKPACPPMTPEEVEAAFASPEALMAAFPGGIPIGDPKPPCNSMWESVGRAINTGIMAGAISMTDYACRSSTDDRPCDIHELAVMSHQLAEMVKAIRELYRVPGCRAHLKSQPADVRDDEYGPL